MFPYTGKSEMHTTNLGIPRTVFYPGAINSFQTEKYLIAALEESGREKRLLHQEKKLR